MGDMAASALVQEGVSGVSSYVSSKLKEKASTPHMVLRLEMALSQLEFSLERTGKMPITYVSLLRRRKLIKQAYIDGTNILNKHKMQLVEGNKETRQLATGSSFLEWVIHAAKLSVSSLIGLEKGYLTSSVVQMFEYYADCAAKFVTEVESGNPLQHITFCYPLVRHLLEEKILRYEVMKGSRAWLLILLGIHLEDRGVEARLGYTYMDTERPEQCFHLALILRLSEDTDIVGITIKCLQLVTYRFNLATESAIGELTQLSHSPDISKLGAHEMAWITENHAELSKLLRPDPVCCTNDVVSSESSIGAPEPVIAIHFEYMLHSSTDRAVSRNEPPLYVTALFVPHTCSAQQGFVLKYGVTEEYIGGSIQQMEGILRLKAADCVLHQPGKRLYHVSWYSTNGVVFIILGKSSNEQRYPNPKPATALRRRSIVFEYRGKEHTQVLEVKSKVFDHVIGQVEPAHYVLKWLFRDYTTRFTLCERRDEQACPKPTGTPGSSRSAAKRKR
ncbi:hypothetical protein ACP4OV_011832 [Aristida adscensionis]